MSSQENCFTSFKTSTDGVALPERFTFPFYYDPHPLGISAATQLQDHLKNQKDWQHNFGLIEGQEGTGIGKMFGVLVVENKQGELGYLSAFSGKMANANHHPGFVPPVYDMLKEEGFFKAGTAKIDELTVEIESKEQDADYLRNIELLGRTRQQATKSIEEERESMRLAKIIRKQKRSEGKLTLGSEEYILIEKELTKESLHRKHTLRV